MNASLVGQFPKKSILAIGDLVLDSYLEGDVSRISPEAPVPVLHVEKERFVLGGAANTIANCAHLGAHVEAVGIIGNDAPGKKLRALFSSIGVGHGGVVVDDKRPTIRKTRLVTQRQQLARIDYEHTSDIPLSLEKKMLSQIRKRMTKSDAVIISDYHKGTITETLAKEVISLARKQGIPLIVDTKPDHMLWFVDATLITPNRKEASTFVGYDLDDEESVIRAGKELVEKTKSNILITLGERGMVLMEKEGKTTAVPTQAKEVFDVSGAGDTVVAVMTLGLASNASLSEAAILANHAAGIVVGKVGTVAITKDELAQVIATGSTKVKSLPELKKTTAFLKKQGKRIVWTNGCFDILHVGHTRYLQEAHRLGDVLILGLNTDASVHRFKGKGRPILPERARAEVLSALSSVDYILFFDESTPIRQIKELMPDIIVKGGDYKAEDVVGFDVMKKQGGNVVIIPLIEGFSTTTLINKIRDQ
ncbi:MAG: D-glycero-beta-D-manno-heptose-7-phosphate kinase [Nanoarchaeota archaeon]